MANRTTQISECLSKLYDLMPDGIVTFEVSVTKDVSFYYDELLSLYRFGIILCLIGWNQFDLKYQKMI
jgi:hypothetical protein